MAKCRELQSSIGKLCINERGTHFNMARLSNNYDIVNKGLTMTWYREAVLRASARAQSCCSTCTIFIAGHVPRGLVCWFCCCDNSDSCINWWMWWTYIGVLSQIPPVSATFERRCWENFFSQVTFSNETDLKHPHCMDSPLMTRSGLPTNSINFRPEICMCSSLTSAMYDSVSDNSEFEDALKCITFQFFCPSNMHVGSAKI